MLTIKSRNILDGTFWDILMEDEILYTVDTYKEARSMVEYLNACDGY